MRIGLVVDSACDLPQAFIQQHHIEILPITVRIGADGFVDYRDPEATLVFYQDHMSEAAGGETSAFSVDQIKGLFYERLIVDYDYVFCLTVARTRSPIHENAQQAALAILSDYKTARIAAGVTGPFALRVFDTRNLFAGQGILAAEVARLIAAGRNPAQIRGEIERLLPHVYGYMLPASLHHLRTRAHKKGDKSVTLVRYLMGSALDVKPVIQAHDGDTRPVVTIRHFDQGARRCFAFLGRLVENGKLMTSFVNLAFSGPMEDLHALPGYADFIGVAEQAGVTVLESVMSITGGVNVGAGALAFGVITDPPEFD